MSLTRRLTTFFLVAVAILLVGTSAALYRLTWASLRRDVDERLSNVLDTLAFVAIDRPGMVEWRPGLWAYSGDGDRHDASPVRWAVFDGVGTLVERSWDLGDADLAAVLALVPEAGHSHLRFLGKDGRRWRLALRRLRALPALDADGGRQGQGQGQGPPQPPSQWGEFLPGPANVTLFLAVGERLEPIEAELWGVGLRLAGVSVVLWLLAWLTGRRFCRRALRPIAAMAEAARAMSADHSEPLPSPGTGDELEDLAGSFNGLLGRLRQAIDRQAQFAGDASHQLRTPLTALIGEIEVARRRDRSAEDYRQVLDTVHAEALHLREIIESLLFLARPDSEATCPNLRPVDLATWLPAHLATLSLDDRQCDIRTVVADPGPLLVRAHAPLLAQLVENLVENACKYSDPGTPIVVTLRRNPSAPTVILCVEDRGIGLSPDELSHVFEPFYRTPSARLRGRPGVGIGLALVRRIASTLGGTVSATSTPGLGTRFLVELPSV